LRGVAKFNYAARSVELEQQYCIVDRVVGNEANHLESQGKMLFTLAASKPEATARLRS
jgi:hypothetical protein